MPGLKEDFEADYSVGDDNVDDRPEWPDDPNASDGMLKQPTEAVALMAHQEMNGLKRLQHWDVDGYKHDFKQGEDVDDFDLEWFWSTDVLAKVDKAFGPKPLGTHNSIGKFAFILHLRKRFLNETENANEFLTAKGHLSRVAVSAIIRQMRRKWVSDDIQQRRNGCYRVNGKDGMGQINGAGGASSPASSQTPKQVEQYEQLSWDGMTREEKQFAKRRFLAELNRHYGVTKKQPDRGRTEHQHRYTSDEVEKMRAKDRTVTSVPGVELVKFVLQHGTCLHTDLSKFIDKFVKEGEDRRADDERAKANANNPHLHGASKPKGRHCTPLLFPLPYIPPPTEIAHRFSNSEQEEGGVGK